MKTTLYSPVQDGTEKLGDLIWALSSKSWSDVGGDRRGT